MSVLTYLHELGLYIDPYASVIICSHPECQYALCLKGSRVATHLQQRHNVPRQGLKGLKQVLKSIPNLCSSEKATLYPDGSPVHQQLRVYDGYVCVICGFRTVSLAFIRDHIHGHQTNRDYRYNKAPALYAVDQLFEPVFLQTWAAGPAQSYWIVECEDYTMSPVYSQSSTSPPLMDYSQGLSDREEIPTGLPLNEYSQIVPDGDVEKIMHESIEWNSRDMLA
ncbi:hypothetical protein NQ176_g9424 [Zarea fungicola]|uniref:Uncharacterized protein n=1 Tax=Zarea fungicola TaxID=93591 RepID=A0ACC1MMN2_9HYPO|nr:hypothetical protein NQ176_g9424 [Lecanicillium fungicola]